MSEKIYTNKDLARVWSQACDAFAALHGFDMGDDFPDNPYTAKK